MTTSTWNDSNDNWSTSADWTGGLPTSTSDVVVPVGDPQVTSAITINSLNDSAAVTFAGAGTCSVAAGVTNSGGLLVEDNGGIISPVGTSLSIGGTLINSGTVGIGTDGLFAAVTVNATAINNFIGATLGTLNIAGNTSHGIRFTPISATLNIGSAAGFGTAGVLSGSVNISGNPLGTGLIEFASGQITTIALNSELTLSGPDAFIADASNTTSSSALTGLSTITGALNLDNAPLSVSGALSVGGTMNIDDNDGIRGPGGSSVSVGGMLSNSGSVGLGVSDVSAPTNLMAAGFTNNSGGNFNVTGNTAPVPAMWQALFTVNGSAVNYGNVTIGGGGEILVSGSNSYTQDGGTTTVNGTLSANAINLGGAPWCWEAPARSPAASNLPARRRPCSSIMRATSSATSPAQSRVTPSICASRLSRPAIRPYGSRTAQPER